MAWTTMNVVVTELKTSERIGRVAVQVLEPLQVRCASPRT